MDIYPLFASERLRKHFDYEIGGIRNIMETIYLKDLLETLPYDDEIELTAREIHYETQQDATKGKNGKIISTQVVVASPKALFKVLSLSLLLAKVISISNKAVWEWTINSEEKQMMSILCDYSAI